MNLKKKREENKMTQGEVARLLNVRRTAVLMWENGKSLPRADKLPKLAAIYGCGIGDLFEEGGGQNGDTL